jgi:DNA-directed RNA polymerase subunit RPC12/RpoP
VRQQTRSTYVVTDPSEIVEALVGLKDVRVLAYSRHGPDVELVIEQAVSGVRCPACSGPALVKERPIVHYVDLPVYGTPMSLAWKKHRMRCANPACPKKTWVLADHRIAAKHCLLTTRAAKWATRQVGGGRTVAEVAAELACDSQNVRGAASWRCFASGSVGLTRAVIDASAVFCCQICHPVPARSRVDRA